MTAAHEKQIKYFLLALMPALVFSCRHVTRTYSKDQLKTTDSYWRFPTRSTSYTKRGVTTVRDTVENYLVSKTRYKSSIGCFHIRTIRLKTIIYNKKHQRLEKVVIRHGKKKKIEYLKHQEKIKIRSF